MMPTALDLVEPASGDISAKATARVLALRPQARRFVFDAEASVHLGHFIRDCGDLIIANRRFAIPPFETVYLQCDIHTMIKAIGRQTSGNLFGGTPLDLLTGYLVHKGSVWPIAAGEPAPGKLRSGIGGFRYDLDTPVGSAAIFPGICLQDRGNEEWARMALLLGTTSHDMPDEETRLDIIHSIRITPNFELDWRKKSDLALRVFYGGMGDIRNLWAMLLLLNQTQRIRLEQVPWRAAIVKGRRKVYAAHSLVRLNLAPHETLRKVMLPSLRPLPRRRHAVRGHFMHIHLRQHCIHVWPALPEIDDNNTPRWTCQNCKGLRIWRRDHWRGTAAEGFVDTDYSVTHRMETP
jgi:hypothetical protein